MSGRQLILGPSADDFINLALETLTEREKLSLVYRFGIGGHSTMTYNEIGKTFGVTKERARILVRTALRKLRRPWCRKLLVNHSCNERRCAISHNRPAWWCEHKYHGCSMNDTID